MKIKPDENIGRRGIELLTSAGHDVTTVREQNLQGARGETLFDVCGGENRVLITLDWNQDRV
jgi:predicted nuclease of predicted toxin-antitoxin system